MNEVVPLPWQKKQWMHLYQCHQVNRLAHALLFTGQIGLGKSLFAASFAKTLLCKKALVSGACHRCRDCLLVAANTHPELSYIVPSHKGIKIEQIREGLLPLNQTTQSPYKILVINPADSLWLAASNALLKNLEEPTARTLFILITDKPELLLPTIRSRCQIIRFIAPIPSVGKTWIREQLPNIEFIDELYDLADGAPLHAIEYAKIGLLSSYQSLLNAMLLLLKKEIDPIKLAENYLKTEWSILLPCLMKIVSAILKCKLQVSDTDSVSVLHLLANTLTLTFLFNYFDKLLDLQRHAKTALNQQLMLEDLFCCWSLQEINKPC
jgi:DNA polymerase-3 subunit delta'